MKRSLSLLLSLVLLCALLAGCAGTACPPASGGGDQEPSPKGAPATARCRVVSVSENNVLLLADVDSERGDIYTLDAGELSLEHDQAERGELLADSQLAAGALVEVAYGGDILESYPALFGGVERITVLPDEFDDRCALYLRVLNDLWGKDEGLNSSGVEYISVDLAATSLTPAERSAVAWTFAQSHGAEPMELSYEQLCAEGYISGLTGENAFPQWEKGILFTITETDEPVLFSLPSMSEGEEEPSMSQFNIKNTVSFDASKWRTALGAYGFSKCVAVQNNDGVWGDYHINGPEWIS
ncbi:MAG: hypothetical protein ACLS8S_02870 [Oscillospiraceae bacterium]|jgi:hypothetical protein